MGRVIRVGSRKSLLALAQTDIIVKKLMELYPEISFEVVGMVTEGDMDLDGSRKSKDVFVKAIEEKLLEGEIDIAVHSLKDMPVQIQDQLTIAAIPMREDPRDALISAKGAKLADLPGAARIGTSSLRRKAQLQLVRPDLNIVEIRGNVGTRIEKMRRLNLDAIILAYSGLKRLGLQDIVTEVLDPQVMLPAAGQGALAVESRRDDEELIKLVKAIEDRNTRIEVEAERYLLSKIGGGCNVPAAAYAQVTGKRLTLEGMVVHDASNMIALRGREDGYVWEATGIAGRLAEKLMSRKSQTECINA
jgi:hydroxymethylbilane synthase